MIRTFVAVELDRDLRKVLGRVQAEVRERCVRGGGQEVRVQWVKPDSIHLTLKFLGEIEEARIQDLRTALGPVVAGQPRFSVEVGGLGVFPDLRAPRVIWIGLSGRVDELVRLAADVDRALHTIGFPLESRPWSPHLTLARIKERSREAGKGFAATGALNGFTSVGSLSISVASLMQSELKPSGAVYSQLLALPLKEV